MSQPITCLLIVPNANEVDRLEAFIIILHTSYYAMFWNSFKYTESS